MKSEKNSGRQLKEEAMRASATSTKKLTVNEIYALVFGAFLGLAMVKFGNPAILDSKIVRPVSLHDYWTDAWPLPWGNWLLVMFALFGAALVFAKKIHWPGTRWLWILPTVWFCWQLVSASRTVDKQLTALTLWQLGGCVACYFLGALVIGRGRGWRLMLIGLLAAFTFCLVRAVNQRLFEFPRDRQFLLESQLNGWTNVP